MQVAARLSLHPAGIGNRIWSCPFDRGQFRRMKAIERSASAPRAACNGSLRGPSHRLCYRGPVAHPTTQPPAVEIENLSYHYGQRAALAGVSFSVSPGEIFGLLGPNGGGKTTLFHILSTLLLPATGTARIFGIDVAQDPLAVRKRIGVVFQSQSLDRRLTVRENLLHQGHLYGLRGAVLAERMARVLDRLGLSSRSNDVVATLSGGLQRRVELAKGLLHQPDLLLLDEPSTGIDPRARLDFWRYLQALRSEEGVTVLLTTHLLEEADKCDRLAILDEGSLVGEGAPRVLKSQIGGDVVVLSTPDTAKLLSRLQGDFDIAATVVNSDVRFEHHEGSKLVPRLMETLPEQIDSVTVSHPSLEDVFIRLTGHRFEEPISDADRR